MHLTDVFGNASLSVAAEHGHVGAVQLLLEYGAAVDATASDGITALMHAAYKGHEAVLRLLLKEGATVDAKASSGKTALMLAAGSGQIGAVRLLLKHGASMDLIDKEGRCALQWADKWAVTVVSAHCSEDNFWSPGQMTIGDQGVVQVPTEYQETRLLAETEAKAHMKNENAQVSRCTLVSLCVCL